MLENVGEKAFKKKKKKKEGIWYLTLGKALQLVMKSFLPAKYFKV